MPNAMYETWIDFCRREMINWAYLEKKEKLLLSFSKLECTECKVL